MKSEQKEYIQEHVGKKSVEEIAKDLNLKVRKVKRIIERYKAQKPQQTKFNLPTTPPIDVYEKTNKLTKTLLITILVAAAFVRFIYLIQFFLFLARKARPAINPTKPMPMLHCGESPKPVKASPNILPTAPVKKPTTGPKAYPKNIGMAIAGRIATWLRDGTTKTEPLNRYEKTAYRAAPIAI